VRKVNREFRVYGFHFFEADDLWGHERSVQLPKDSIVDSMVPFVLTVGGSIPQGFFSALFTSLRLRAQQLRLGH
jgi:hypothetical protein